MRGTLHDQRFYPHDDRAGWLGFWLAVLLAGLGVGIFIVLWAIY